MVLSALRYQLVGIPLKPHQAVTALDRLAELIG